MNFNRSAATGQGWEGKENQANSNKRSRQRFITCPAHGSDESNIQIIFPTMMLI